MTLLIYFHMVITIIKSIIQLLLDIFNTVPFNYKDKFCDKFWLLLKVSFWRLNLKCDLIIMIVSHQIMINEDKLNHSSFRNNKCHFRFDNHIILEHVNFLTKLEIILYYNIL